MLNSKQKICLVGESGVGKSSLLSLLQGKEISTERTPTIGLEIENSDLNGNKCAIWDLGGQERFKSMWKDFMRGAGLTVLVCDSTEDGIERTKMIHERFSRHMQTKMIAIANKQDLPGALNAEEVQKRLNGLKTYGMSAIRTDLRNRMREILEHELENE